MAPHTVPVQNNCRTSERPSCHSELSKRAFLPLLFCLLCSISLGCAVSSSSSPSSAQQNAQAATSTGVVTPQFFGMVVRSSTHQPSVAVGSQRLWDAGVTWAALEPAEGSFAWDTLDAEVSAAQAAGAEVTLTLGMTPTWASSQPGLASSYGAGATAMPANLAAWDAYVAAVATRYAGRIANYEVWNAPSDASYWSGSAAQLGSDMATLSAHAAAAVHAHDAQAKIVAPALDAGGLSQFLAAGGASSVDILAGSLDLAGQAPEAATAQIAALRAALGTSAAQTKPLWNDQPAWTLPAGGLSADDQAAYAARSLLVNASYGISRLAWYAWDEDAATALRLTDSNGQATEAALAYGVVEGWLNGATINGCSANAEQLWSCQIVRGGQPAWILWSAAGTIQTSSLGMATMTDLQGNEQATDGSGFVAVGGSPILLQ